jgi:hypothetical protein
MIVLKKDKSGQTMQIDLRAPLYNTAVPPVVTITNYSGDELVSSGSSVYDTATWTTTVAAGRGASTPKQVSLAALGEGEAQITPGDYFLYHTGGQWEKVTVLFSTTTSATLAGNPQLAYPVSSKLIKATAVYTFPTAVIEKECDFTMNIVYYIGTSESMVAYNMEGTVSTSPAMCPVTVEDIYRIWPQLEIMMPVNTSGQDIANKLDSVWDNIRSTLTSTGMRPEQFKAVSALKQVVIYELAMILGLAGIDPTGGKNPSEFRTMIEKTLRHKWDLLYTTKQFIDVDNSGKKSAGDNQRGQGRLIEW